MVCSLCWERHLRESWTEIRARAEPCDSRRIVRCECPQCRQAPQRATIEKGEWSPRRDETTVMDAYERQGAGTRRRTAASLDSAAVRGATKRFVRGDGRGSEDTELCGPLFRWECAAKREMKRKPRESGTREEKTATQSRSASRSIFEIGAGRPSATSGSAESTMVGRQQRIQDMGCGRE